MYIERVVVGGGIVGRMASYLLHAPIVEPAKPGTKGFTGLHYLHPSKGMDALLVTLGVQPEIEEVKAGVVWWREPIDSRYLSQSQRIEVAEAYCVKTRGCSLEELPQDDVVSIMDGILDDRELLRYQISFGKLQDILYKATHSQTLYGVRIESVVWEDRFFRLWDCATQTPTNVEYKHMVATAPLKKFISGTTSDLQSESSHYYVFALRDNSWLSKLDYGYLYLVGNVDVDRITFPHNLGEDIAPNIICIESSKQMRLGRWSDFLDHMEAGKARLLYSGINNYKRMFGDGKPYVDRIEDGRHNLVGRYARWDNSLLVSDAADRLMEMNNERDI